MSLSIRGGDLSWCQAKIEIDQIPNSVHAKPIVRVSQQPRAKFYEITENDFLTKNSVTAFDRI